MFPSFWVHTSTVRGNIFILCLLHWAKTVILLLYWLYLQIITWTDHRAVWSHQINLSNHLDPVHTVMFEVKTCFHFRKCLCLQVITLKTMSVYMETVEIVFAVAWRGIQKSPKVFAFSPEKIKENTRRQDSCLSRAQSGLDLFWKWFKFHKTLNMHDQEAIFFFIFFFYHRSNWTEVIFMSGRCFPPYPHVFISSCCLLVLLILPGPISTCKQKPLYESINPSLRVMWERIDSSSSRVWPDRSTQTDNHTHSCPDLHAISIYPSAIKH